MPAIKKINREMILEASKEIISKEDESKLNARNIAKYLKCTTQPIYDEFKNMDELKDELDNYIKNIYYDFINNNIKKLDDDNLYIKYIKSYLLFSHLYPKEYKYIFFNSKYKNTLSDKQFNENIIKTIQEKGNYSYESANDFFLLTWIISLGMSTLITNKNYEYELEKVYELLEESFDAFKIYFKGK